MTVTITTAVTLTAKQTETLTAALEKKYGQPVTLTKIIDPQVLGGIKLMIGSTQYDATVAYKLSQLEHQLLNIA